MVPLKTFCLTDLGQKMMVRAVYVFVIENIWEVVKTRQLYIFLVKI